MATSASAYLAPSTTTHPYIIYAASFTELSSRVKAAHLLCHALNQAGHEAYVMTGNTSPWLSTPTITSFRRNALRAANRLPIVVYPETVTGNPLEEPVAVRWLQNKPGALFDNWSGSFHRSDLIFYQDEDSLIDGLIGTSLHLPTADIRAYSNDGNPHDGSRRGHLLYQSRYPDGGEPIARFLDWATILSHDTPRTPAELAELYRKSELFFTHEQTSAALEAALCGCPVIYLPSPLLAEMPGQKRMGTDGRAWGFTEGEIARAKRTVEHFPAIYQSLLTDFDGELRRFIEMTQTRAVRIADFARDVKARQQA